jgi:hypothetical protein
LCLLTIKQNTHLKNSSNNVLGDFGFSVGLVKIHLNVHLSWNRIKPYEKDKGIVTTCVGLGGRWAKALVVGSE